MTHPADSLRRPLLRRLVPCVLALGGLGLAVPSAAELVVFTNGHYLRVAKVQVDADHARLDLPAGGTMRVGMHRIERILDDAPSAPAAEDPAPFDGFSLRWTDEAPVPDVPFGAAMHRAARKHGLNPALVAAVARAESAFRADAVSVKGARGLMQLMPATAARFGVAFEYIHDPEWNLDAGSRYLRVLADRFDDDLPLVLAAYNAGEGTVDRYGGVPPYRETRGYLQRIFRHLGIDTDSHSPASPATNAAAR